MGDGGEATSEPMETAAFVLSIAAVVIVAVLLVVLASHAARGGALKLDFYFQLPPSAYHVSSSKLSTSAARIAVSSGQLSFADPRASFVLVGSVVLAVSAAWWLFILGHGQDEAKRCNRAR